MGSAQRSDTHKYTWIALRGRRELPADGVADYCAFLGQALARQGVTLQIHQVPIEEGWLRALLDVRQMCIGHRGNWILLQYTALGWSRRGFPLNAVATMALLRLYGMACAVVFHEPVRQSPTRRNWISSVRGAFQDWVIRALHLLSRKSIYTVPLAGIPWLFKGDSKNVFIPLGANIPECESSNPRSQPVDGGGSTIAVYCVSDPPFREKELSEVSRAMRCASAVKFDLHIVFLGRGTREASDDIANVFAGIPVKVTNLGLCELGEVGRVLTRSDAMLCVRGNLNLRRGSALTGIACGVPVLAYAGAAEGTPLMDAGIEFVPNGDAEALGTALIRVLTNGALQQVMREKNRRVYRSHFSWDTIAAAFVSSIIEEPKVP
jgi:hypothetical protein